MKTHRIEAHAHPLPGAPDESEHNAERRERLIAAVACAVHDKRVLRAMREVPRERFVPWWLRPSAYDDTALAIGDGQMISRPTVVGVMIEALALRGDERLLVIGAASGYEAAVLARLAREVVTVEILGEVREFTERILRELGVRNVHCVPARELGGAELGSFDGILVTAAASAIPPPLIERLRIGGRLVIPIGGMLGQELRVVTRTGIGLDERSLGSCQFVPLVGPRGLIRRPHEQLRAGAQPSPSSEANDSRG